MGANSVIWRIEFRTRLTKIPPKNDTKRLQICYWKGACVRDNYVARKTSLLEVAPTALHVAQRTWQITTICRIVACIINLRHAENQILFITRLWTYDLHLLTWHRYDRCSALNDNLHSSTSSRDWERKRRKSNMAVGTLVLMVGSLQLVHRWVKREMSCPLIHACSLILYTDTTLILTTQTSRNGLSVIHS